MAGVVAIDIRASSGSTPISLKRVINDANAVRTWEM